MLYLVRADGSIEELSTATHAVLDEEQGILICYDEDEHEVARYPKLSVIMFSSKPFPTRGDRGGESEGPSFG